MRHNAIIDDILGDEGISNEDYEDFLRTLLIDSIESSEPMDPDGDRPPTSSAPSQQPIDHEPPSILPTDRPTLDPAVERILTATQVEIDLNGLVGLRVASVAERAQTTVASIYRQFGDRNGLITACLSANLDARLSEIARMPQAVIDKGGPVTIDDILDGIPPLHYEGSDIIHARRQRIYIAALEIPELRASVREIIARRVPDYTNAVRRMIERLPVSERFDERTLTLLLLRYNFMLDDVLGKHGMSNAEFRLFLRDLMVRSARNRRH